MGMIDTPLSEKTILPREHAAEDKDYPHLIEGELARERRRLNRKRSQRILGAMIQ